MSAPDLSPEALARLEEAARAVMDGGPWLAVCMNGPLPDTVTTVDDDPICHALPEDVTYIAAASPDVVLALVQAARERERYRAALEEAIEFADEGWSYASDYFRDKWGFDDGIAKLRADLAQPDEAPE